MLDGCIQLVKKCIPQRLIPRWVFGVYHYILGFLGHLWYGFPSRQMIVIGVTGTKGKTSTCFFLAQFLEQLGYRVALSSSTYFWIGSEKWKNTLKVGMPGRWFLPAFLARAQRARCTVAIIETTSEGIAQHRQRFIAYDAAVFTNLAPEHLERHGGFVAYKNAKLQLFRQLSRTGSKRIEGTYIQKFGVVNCTSQYAKEFVTALGGNVPTFGVLVHQRGQQYIAQGATESIELEYANSSLEYEGQLFSLSIPGAYNAESIALAAVCAARIAGKPLIDVLGYAKTLRPVEGRFEVIARCGIAVVIDYAHEPLSLRSVLQLAREQFPNRRLFHVFGSQGGGRDVWKRPEMGSISAACADVSIITNEDPYSDPPESILADIRRGMPEGTYVRSILDRRQAIETAIQEAVECSGVVVLTGKGAEVVMCTHEGQIPWSERGVVEDILGKICR